MKTGDLLLNDGGRRPRFADTLHRVSQVCELVRDVFYEMLASRLKLLLPGVRKECANREDRLGKGNDMKHREMRRASKRLMR